MNPVSGMTSETLTKTTKMTNRYTKSEVKILKDMTLSDDEVATKINRTKQAVYCKRWTMRLYGKKKRNRKVLFEPTVVDSKPDESIQLKRTVDHIIKTKQFKKLIVGSVTIDLENSVITVNI